MSDLTAWQDKLNALLSELPDKDLANDLQAYSARKLREKLTTSDGPPLDLLTADQLLTTEWPEPSKSLRPVETATRPGQAVGDADPQTGAKETDK